MTTTTLLENLSDQVTLILLETKSEFATVPLHVLNAKSDADAWSVLECFEHLNRYNQYYLSAIEHAIRRNQHSPGERELKSTWIGKKSIEMMHPSNRKKQRTFKRMNPSNSALSVEVMKQFLADQQRLLSVLKEASRSDINAKAVAVEFFKMLKMTIAEAMEFVIVHEQRHLIQAREALNRTVTLARS